eukprot:CAMPEP_0202457472 /NCGR_PEP_ID=MMETSP1360-20130828/14492_1 /ASSEMBLY_ACC=CAM_ASM_000848 /TAXON_ID=515479 /ORGANISM="Licmophora paradoxa, Strain CCMP2313" /LENGTH=123 /DNA_ID=CAMNT_0049077577 /DNA_START=66 /DNA_END=434 /DNA_ORIENTATION=+
MNKQNASFPLQFSAFVFLSETPHGVEPIKWGHREMFTNEYWIHYDVPYPDNRPDEDAYEVYCWKVDQNDNRHREMQQQEMKNKNNHNMRRRDDEDADDDGAAFLNNLDDVDFPTDEETVAWFR